LSFDFDIQFSPSFLVALPLPPTPRAFRTPGFSFWRLRPRREPAMQPAAMFAGLNPHPTEATRPRSSFAENPSLTLDRFPVAPQAQVGHAPAAGTYSAISVAVGF
jgi:hypothetical protein